MEAFLQALDAPNRAIFASFRAPSDVQAYLDSLPYVGEDRNRSPLAVMQDRQCHCLDGGLLAALALQSIGYPPRIIDLVPEPFTDDDHVLAIFQVNGHYGAVAKSNFSGLRYREPVHRSLRELVMTYFEVFFNIDGLKTLRAYTRPLHLDAFERCNWHTTDEGVERVSKRLYSLQPIPVVSPDMVARLSRMDERAFNTNMLGVNLDGLYKGPPRIEPARRTPVMPADVTQIQCFRPISPSLLTAGQPMEDQFEAIRDAGCQVVINLADEDATDYLPDEPDIVEAFGLTYLNIPVAWSPPQLDDLLAFFEAMQRYTGHKIFLHCARNMRVSAFVYLYRILRLGWAPADSLPDLYALWQPNETWQAFIDLALSPDSPARRV